MSEMKDSEIERIGKIPSDWNVVKLKHHFDVICGATPKSEISGYWDGDVNWFTPSDMEEPILFSSARKITMEGLNSCGTTLVPTGSVVISTRAPIGKISTAGVELCTNQGCKTLVEKKNREEFGKFAYYYLLTQTEALNAMGKGSTFLELSTSDLENYHIPTTTSKEASKIVTVLDDFVDKIDKSIIKIQKHIALLEEYKKSVITEAVTKGLDPDASMKDSGVEWIGRIPIDWTCGKLKNIATCLDGKRIPLDASERRDGQYPYWGAGNIVDHVDDFIFDEELVLLGEDGAPFFDKTRDVAFHIEGKVWINNHIHVLKPKEGVDYAFLTHALNSVDYGFYLSGSIFPKLTQKNMNNIRLPMPPINVQIKISKHLENICPIVDLSIEKNQKYISLLEEYKKSVIYEYVTGKKQIEVKV